MSLSSLAGDDLRKAVDMLHGNSQSPTGAEFRSGDPGISKEGSGGGYSRRTQKAGILSKTGDC